MGLQTQKLGGGPQAFLKIKLIRLNREQRQMPAYSRKILGITVAGIICQNQSKPA